jgi:hypothetical protein
MKCFDMLTFSYLVCAKCHLVVVLLTKVYSGSKFCPAVHTAVCLYVVTQNFRDFSLFSVC